MPDPLEGMPHRGGNVLATTVRRVTPQQVPCEPKVTVVFRILISRITAFKPLFYLKKLSR